MNKDLKKMFLRNKQMSSIKIKLDDDNEELILAVKIIQSIIDKNDAQNKQWELKRNQRKKKKTIDELIQEIREEIKYQNDSIIDSNVEIQNLELKRAELEKRETDVIKKAVKAIKTKREKKVKIETELTPE